MTRQNIVFLTGAGISAESGLSTFRGADGLWNNEDWRQLASIYSLRNRTQESLDFYNWRRKKLAEVAPNEAHYLIAQLEEMHNVTILTQNVDNLHERAGSTRVIHLHGELSKVCSMDNREDPSCIMEYPLTTPIKVGDKAKDGSQLRPYIVLFGETLDTIDVATDIVRNADIFIVIGTSLAVNTAYHLVSYAHKEIPKFVIDPNIVENLEYMGFTHIKEKATKGIRILMDELSDICG